MKKKLGFLSGILLATGIAVPQQAGAEGENVDYDIDVNSPRMHYQNNEEGQPIPFDFDTVNYGEQQTYNMSLEVIDDNGNRVEELTLFQGNTAAGGVASGQYQFTNENMNDHGGAFAYRLYDNQEQETLMKGYVAENPSDAFNSGTDSTAERSDYKASGIGDVVYNDAGIMGYLHSPTNEQQVLMQQGEYLLMHYRIPSAIEDGDEMTFRLADENNREIEAEFSMQEIMDFQENRDTTAARESFVVLNSDGTLPEFVDDKAETDFVGDNPFTQDLDKGVYSYEIFDDADNSISSEGESVVLVGNEPDEEWENNPENEEIAVGSDLELEIIRETEEINALYNNHELVLVQSDENKGNVLESSYSRTTIINLDTSDYDQGDTITAIWEQESIHVSTYFGVNNSYMNFEDNSSTTVREIAEFQDSFSSFLNSVGLSDTAGKLAVASIMMVATALAISYWGGGMTVIAIAELSLIAVFTVMGLLPAWLPMSIIILVVFGIVMKMNSGGGE